MQVRMTKVAVVGPRRSLEDALAALHRARCVELVDSSAVPGVPGDPPADDPERDRRAGALSVFPPDELRRLDAVS